MLKLRDVSFMFYVEQKYILIVFLKFIVTEH